MPVSRPVCECLTAIHLLVDLQPDNFLFHVSEDSIFRQFEQEELQNPSARKVDLEGNRTVYEARSLQRPRKVGHTVLCDFGEARFGQETYSDDIQPFAYRAPEVILQVPWSYSVDIWNAGLAVSITLYNTH